MNATETKPAPPVGSKVYTCHLRVLPDHREVTGYKVEATIRARQFNGVIENWLGSCGLRWSIGKLGSAANSTNIPLLPERVHTTREEAGRAMVEQINRLIVQLGEERKKVQL